MLQQRQQEQEERLAKVSMVHTSNFVLVEMTKELKVL